MAYSEDVNINFNILAGAMGGITAITTGMSALTSTFGQFGTEAASNFGTVDGIIATSTVLVSTFGVKAAEAFGEFEQGMKIVQAVSGQSSAAMNELEQSANRLSVAYRTSIGDITEGLQTLGRAGLNSAQSQIEVLEDGLQTAKLEGRSLNGVLEELIQNTAMLGGDLKSVDFGDQAEYINSLMVGTSMSAPIDTHDVSQTLQYAGGTAAAAGANLEDKEKLEDLMGTVAAFAQKGVVGSMAGTALRAFFTKPASQDDSVKDALGSLGLRPESLWEDGGESMKKVSDQIGLIQNRMDALNLSTMDQVELWGKIVGPKMGQQMMKLEADSIKDLTSDIQEARTAQELSAETLNTYSQQLAAMQQQGDVVFRGFGEKIARFLYWPLQGVIKVLEALSNPWVNLIAFVSAGSLVAHGISKVWGMIKAVAADLKGLSSMALDGIQQVNAGADRTTGAFRQNAEQVDFLNRKLQETNATLQQIQAKSMGIRPGYQLPGGLYTDTVAPRTLKAYEEDVILDTYGVMGDGEDKYYSGDKKAQFEEKVDAFALKANEDKKAIKEGIESSEKQIADLQKQWNTEYQKLYSAELERIQNEYKQVKKDNDFLRARDVSEAKDMEAAFGPGSGPSPDEINAFYDRKDEKAKASMDAQISELNNTTDALKEKAGKQYKPLIDKAKSELAEYEQIDLDKMPEYSEETIKKMKEDGISKLRTELKIFDEFEMEEWQKRMNAKNSGASLYSLERTEQLYVYDQQAKQWAVNTKSTIGKLYEKELTEMLERGYLAAFESTEIPEAPPNAQVLGQGFNDGHIKEQIEAREAIKEQQLRSFMGKDGMTTKLHEKFEDKGSQSLGRFSGAVDAASNKLAGFGAGVDRWKERRGWSDTHVRDNVPAFQKRVKNLLKDDDFVQKNIAGKGTGEAMANLARAANLTATEFANVTASAELYRESGLYENEAEKLGQVSDEINDMIAESIAQKGEEMGLTAQEMAAREELIASIKAEILANKQAAISEAEESMSNKGSALGNVANKAKGAIETVTGALGGTFMTAIMGVTIAMQALQAWQQSWQQDMEKATQQLSEAEDKRDKSEEAIKQIYQSENSSLTEADLDKALESQYANIYDAYYTGEGVHEENLNNRKVAEDADYSGSVDEETGEYNMLTPEEMKEINEGLDTFKVSEDENIIALNENTAQLAAATSEYAKASAKVQEKLLDGAWGYDGFFSDTTDWLGKAWEQLTTERMDWNKNGETYYANKGFLDNMEGIMTGSQSASDYEGGTEFAALFAMDMQRFQTGNKDDDPSTRYAEGLHQFFGSDYDRIISLMGDIDAKIEPINGKGETQYINPMAQYMNTMGNMSPQEMAEAQVLMKNNKSSLQRLGKTSFRYEQTRGFQRSAWNDVSALKQALNQKRLGDKTGAKDTLNKIGKKKLNVQDKNLINALKRFRAETGTKLDDQQILTLSQLQQLQDMNDVAQQTVAPGIMSTVQNTYDTVGTTGQGASEAGTAAGGAMSAAANAGIIANLLGAQAQEAAEKAAWKEYEHSGQATMSEEEFMRNIGNPNVKELDPWRDKVYRTLARTSYTLENPMSTPEDRANAEERIMGKLRDTWGYQEFQKGGYTYQQMLNTLTRPIVGYAEKATMDAYERSNIGEYGSGGSGGGGGGSGGGGGGGGGGGSRDSDRGGTRKERVDLVLCNKKEIPKLNVNLFKKAPNFTVLNKNFRLRDLKITSQDKPKAIMNAVKNGIIETQKRMDPKIIQDEDAVYDPVDATEGSTPKGNTKTTT